MLYYFLVFIHLIVCVGLIFFILIQSNKGMGLSGAFGAMGGSDSVFSTSGGMNILVKITIVLSLVFTVSTLALSLKKPPMETGGIMQRSVGDQPQSVKELIQQVGDTSTSELPAAQGNETEATTQEQP